MNFDEWMLTKDPKYHQSDDTVQLRRMRECWNDAQRYGGVSADVFPAAHRLALELECLLLDTKDNVVVSKWWDSANEALEQWRILTEADQKHISPLGVD